MANGADSPQASGSPSGNDGMSAIEREHELMRKAREAEAKAQAELSQRIAENRAAERERYANSEQGEARAQEAEAERLMRLPTPQTLKETGQVVGDPTKGPAS